MEHSGENRRWRGTLDVPLTKEGWWEAIDLSKTFPEDFDLVIHDGLSRCRDTALSLLSKRHLQNSIGPRPWNMGPCFEGTPVNDSSIAASQLLVATNWQPHNGERFSDWLEDWMTFVNVMDYSYPHDRVAVVTHNRNIQSLYAHHNDEFHQKLYNCDGPGFLSVHYYNQGHIAPWNETDFPPGLYFIRHSETAFGA